MLVFDAEGPGTRVEVALEHLGRSTTSHGAQCREEALDHGS
jgi:hypothetical protein